MLPDVTATPMAALADEHLVASRPNDRRSTTSRWRVAAMNGSNVLIKASWHSAHLSTRHLFQHLQHSLKQLDRRV